MISPLVSQMSDSLLNLIRIEAPPYFIAQCIEQHLRSMYLKSQLLSEYLIEGAQASLLQPESCHSAGGKSLYNLTELTHTLEYFHARVPECSYVTLD
ncbi:hypothetical protein Anas_10320 [Armadillidium nasatum]|uniref:Folliculin-interacting protein C-terminal domain-containing protein n=1 Tax=Armadillidium nasatum TaxID=96803 RepID=A0A5N5TDU3_9CRUS|nr:hypothetical protein Anas_10320 [Armadillidium nasatum]